MAIDHEMHRARVKAISSPKHPMEYNDGGAERAKKINELKGAVGSYFKNQDKQKVKDKAFKEKWRHRDLGELMREKSGF